jgi:hypothetical protein
VIIFGFWAIAFLPEKDIKKANIRMTEMNLRAFMVKDFRMYYIRIKIRILNKLMGQYNEEFRVIDKYYFYP